MFFGYCLFPDGRGWTPAITLPSATAAYRYCALHAHRTREIRITDDEDFVVLHMLDQVFHIPLPDGSVRRLPLTPELRAVIDAAKD